MSVLVFFGVGVVVVDVIRVYTTQYIKFFETICGKYMITHKLYSRSLLMFGGSRDGAALGRERQHALFAHN